MTPNTNSINDATFCQMDMALIFKNNIVADLSIGNGSHNNTINIQNQYKTITINVHLQFSLNVHSSLSEEIIK
jgi:hypothetical protein